MYLSIEGSSESARLRADSPEPSLRRKCNKYQNLMCSIISLVTFSEIDIQLVNIIGLRMVKILLSILAVLRVIWIWSASIY